MKPTCMVFNVMMAMSRDEALNYISSNLNIPDAANLLNVRGLHLLNKILTSFHARVPIQTITLHAVPMKWRHRPNWVTVKENVCCGVGGLCYELNIFMFALLSALGFDVYLTKSSVSQPHNHVVIIARNVASPGDLFLVDAGCGFPTFQAVDLNFDLESAEYCQSFLCYKLVKQSNGKVLRLHKRHSLVKSLEPNDAKSEWKRYYDFELKPFSIEEIDEEFDRVFETYTATTSHAIFRCTMFPGQRACAIRNKVVLVENDTKELDGTEYETSADLVNAVCGHFPVFQEYRALVSKAVNTLGLFNKSV
ncbi:uncharacterized protein LOC135480700 [Liolophura sinensis]|uniref:uncharacterized protein LOC135480700 n=1 Tax=Liolophura sinensis TaxID=3198878 RepID=UPI00315915BF